MSNVKKCAQQKLFPWNFIICGMLICCLLIISKIVAHHIENPVLAFLGIIVVSFIVGYIPMKIAHERQTKHRRGIYILSVVAMSIGSFLISIPAIVWACCDKKLTENNKNNQNTVQSDNKQEY